MSNLLNKAFWKKLLLVSAGLFAAATVTIGAAIYGFTHTPSPVNSSAAVTKESTDTTAGKRINILLLGVDDGDPDTPGAPRRSDTMMVAGINPGDGTINLLSIPRDTRTVIPGRSGEDKITHAFAYGGVSLAVRTVEQMLGIPIDYYVIIDWKAFIRVIDILGGVDMNVGQAMNYDDPYENLHIHLTKGYQHLNGEQAGEYVRFRHDELGDIGRVQRQQQFLKVLCSELLQAGTIFKLPALVTTLRQYVQTDMPLTTMAKLAAGLKSMQLDSIQAEMLPGDFATIANVSYWIEDKVKTRKLVTDLFCAGGTQ
ncbi:MAG: LCP family protein [Veillonellales bacterium]